MVVAVTTQAYKLNHTHDVAVATHCYWQPMSSCPLGVKVLLLGQGGVATIAEYRGKGTFWRGWFPMPKIKKDPHD